MVRAIWFGLAAKVSKLIPLPLLPSFPSQENQPAFVEAMGDWLTESGRRMRRPRVVQALMRESNNKYSADMDVMRELAREIVAERKNCPNDRKDLLNAMLNGRDPQTGSGLTDQSIEDQVRFCGL